MNKSSRGFTIIELIVVIVVIGILSAISSLSLSKTQIDARDKQRLSSITMISEALEAYYSKNGEYPDCGEMTTSSDSVKTNILNDIDTKILTAPNVVNESNSFICTDPINSSTYSYIKGGRRFILKYKQESDGVVKSIYSRHGINVTINVTVLGAGGGGAGGDFYCPAIAGPGGDGGESSITYSYKNITLTSYGGTGGFPCYINGSNGNVLITNASNFINTANPALGGGSLGGIGGEDTCLPCEPATGGNGGAGGKISGSIIVRAGKQLNIIVGVGGSRGEPYPASTDNATAGENGLVTISYLNGQTDTIGGTVTIGLTHTTHTFNSNTVFTID